MGQGFNFIMKSHTGWQQPFAAFTMRDGRASSGLQERTGATQVALNRNLIRSLSVSLAPGR